MSVETSPLTPEQSRDLRSAMLVAVETAPYFAMALWRVIPVAAHGLGTFAVDGGWRLYIDPAAMRAWGPRLSGAVLVHEVGHLLREHAERASALGPNRNHTAWNYATDAAINADLIAGGIVLPEGAVTPESLGLTPNGIEESYYHQLTSVPPESAVHPDGGGCGSGAGDPAAPWELASGNSQAPALSPAQQRVTRRQVAEKVMTAPGGNGIGLAPAGLRRWAQDVLAPPTVDWRKTLRAAIVRAINHVATGQQDFTYRRPGRRQIAGVVTPAMQAYRPTVAVVLDTSGSMSTVELQAALSEVQGITKAARTPLSVISVDTAATTTHNVTRASQVQVVGGGGTDMRVGIRLARQQRPAPDIIIVLTDGYTPWPSAPLPQPLIAGLIGPHPGEAPAWARSVHITTDA